jgi:hypothetical protein
MKQVVFFIFCLSLVGCLQSDSNKSIELTDTQATVNKLLDEWHQSAANANLENYIGSMSEDATYIGTDATENWKRSEFETFCKPYFDKKTTWDFKRLSRNVYFSKNQKLSWFDEILETHMGTCRGSGVLENNNGDWKIKQYVLSMAIPNESTEAVKTAKKVDDDLFLQSMKK